jgi:hypothetical protein
VAIASQRPSLARFDVAHFRSCLEGGGQQISSGNRSGGVGIAEGVTRRTRGARRGSRWARVSARDLGVTRRTHGARRGSPDPAGLPDRQVSRAHRRPQFQRCSSLLSLPQTQETYRSSIWAGSGDPRPARVRAWGGVRRPAPSAGAFQGGVQQTTAQRQNWRVGLLASECRWSRCANNRPTPRGPRRRSRSSGYSVRIPTPPRFQRKILVNILCRHLTKCSVRFLHKIV